MSYRLFHLIEVKVTDYFTWYKCELQMISFDRNVSLRLFHKYKCDLQIISFDICVNLQKKFNVWTIVSFLSMQLHHQNFACWEKFKVFFLNIRTSSICAFDRLL